MSAPWIATIDPWVDHWAAGVWRACWQGSAAILFVWAVCGLLPQMSPRIRCWLWRLAYAKLLIALLWTSPVVIPLLRSTATRVSLSAPSREPAAPAAFLPSPLSTEGSGPPAYVVLQQPSLTPLSLLTILWLLGAAMVAAQVGREWRSARLRDQAAPLDTALYAGLAADFESLQRRLGVRRPIALLVTDASDRPHVFGVKRPAIVLPAALLAESDRPGLSAVLAHEIAHVRRKDLLWNWLPAIVHILFFFCPFVWLANREWQLAQELACDDMAVLNTRIDVADYGEMLVRMVTPSRHSPTPGIATLSIVESLQTLHRRLIAMRSIRPISPRKLAVAGGACVALGIFGIVPWQVVAQGARADRILFVSNRGEDHRFSIFAMDPNGLHRVRLTHGPLPESDVVSGPDGKAILQPTAPHRNAMEIDPVWSPDRHRIAFALAVAEKPEPGSRVKTNLYVMNADGSGGKQVTFFDYGLAAAAPAWSPDGAKIAFMLQNRDEGAPGGICSTVCVSDFTGFWPVADGMCPSWSQDGKQVLYSAYSDAKSRTELTPELYEAHSAGAYFGKKKLAHGVLQGALSPDGKRLAYISNLVEPNGVRTNNIFVSNADGSQPQQVTDLHDAGLMGLQWASDGRQIYFTRPTSSNEAGAPNYIIYAMDTDGSHIQALTKGDAADCLGASPDASLTNRWMSRIATMKEAK